MALFNLERMRQSPVYLREASLTRMATLLHKYEFMGSLCAQV